MVPISSGWRGIARPAEHEVLPSARLRVLCVWSHTVGKEAKRARIREAAILMGITPETRTQRAWLTWTIIAPLTVLAVVFVTLRDALTSFRLINEDFALLVNSSRPYFSLSDWHTWFTEGYTSYFLNYPDWPIGGYGFVRPVMNLVFYVQSFVSQLLGDRAYLLAIYVPLAITTGMLVPLFGRYAKVGPTTAGILAITFGLSPVWHEALVWPAIATNTMALTFSVAAILLLQPERGRPSPSRMTAVTACLVFAVASHEAFIFMPLVCGALLYALSSARPRIRELWPLAVPFAYLGLTRVVLESTGVYALDIGMPEIRGRLVRFTMGPLLPYEAERMIFWEPPATALEAIPVLAAILGNAILVTLIIIMILQRRTRQTLCLVAALAISASAGLLMLGAPRFMGVTLVLALVVAFRFVGGHRRAAQLLPALLTAMLLVNVALFSWGVMRAADDHYSNVVFGGAFFDDARDAVREHDPSVVVLVNDRVGYWASRAMLQAVTWPREDIELVVLNNYSGSPDPAAELHVGVDRGVLNVASILGAEQRLRFDGGIPDFSVANAGFTHRALGTAEPDAPGGAFEASKPLAPGDRVLVIGVDPRDESFVSFSTSTAP